MTICENESSSRQYLIPAGNEVAAIMLGQGDFSTSGQRDIVLDYQDGRLQRISNLHRSYMPLLYVLLFPRGEDGWHLKLPYADVDVPTDALTNCQCVSQREYYAYRLQVCLDTNACLLRGGCLLQQFMVDAYCTIEDCRLSWVRNHQHTLRIQLYAGLIDMARSNEGDILGQSVGRRIVLPLSFIGGPRHMYQLYQDAMAIVRAKGKPDLFITFTCNPNWPKVTQALLPRKVSVDRPDITARIFFQKHSSMMRHVLKQNLSGKVIGYMSVVEFQKRGLPHSHTPLILNSICKPRTTSDYDRMICAELLDKGRFPMLHDTIVTCNIHGPFKEFNQSAPCDDIADIAYRKWLMDVGNGTLTSHEDHTMAIPSDMVLSNQSMDGLISYVYLDMNRHLGDARYFRDRAILAPRNSDVDIVNAKTLCAMSGDIVE
ncbi:hypothetical protein L7F22_056475 [Adiantum nelumboides]|nr:hypothetical protein [Adiantum nelumboides]